MKHSRSTRWALITAAAAALGVVTTFNSTVYAQQMITNTGRARDANNRVGSNGLNDPGIPNPYSNAVNNAIGFGDVTGGAAFRGRDAITDPTAFHGNLAGSDISAFVAQSTGVTTSGVLSNNAQGVRLFLGDSRGVAPPANFVSLGNVGGYVPLPPVTTTPFASDTRLGTPTLNTAPSLESAAQAFAPAGSQVNGSSAVSTYQITSPLFGVKQLQNAQQFQPLSGTQALSTDPTTGYLMTGSTPLGSGRLDPMLIQQAKALNNESMGTSGVGGVGSMTPNAGPKTIDELNKQQLTNPTNSTLNPQGSPANNLNNNGTNNGSNPSNPNGNNGQGVNNNGAINSQVNAQVGGGSLSAAPGPTAVNATIGSGPLNSSVQTGENLSDNQLKVVLPSPAYTRMLQQFQQANPNAPLTPVQKNLLRLAKDRDIKAAEVRKGLQTPPPSRVPGNNNVVPPPGAPPAGLTPSPVTPPAGPGAGPVIPSQLPQAKERSKPVMVKSFAQDEPGKGTKELLTKAEDLMKQGKFTSALEQYDLVEQVAPNNPFATLGRANAELGASYYGLAESHLREAFMKEQPLTMAQYDLNTFLGPDRLQFLIKDLKQIATTNPTQARPLFLLSYIMYNTDEPKKAAMYLNEAQKREGTKDPLYDLLKKNWDLPDVSHDKPEGEMNK